MPRFYLHGAVLSSGGRPHLAAIAATSAVVRYLDSDGALAHIRMPVALDNRHPLRRRLVVLIAVAVLPLALLAGLGLFFLARQQDAQAERVGIELARSVANAVNTELDRAVTVLQTLGSTSTLDSGDLDGFRRRALRILSEQPVWSAIILADASGMKLVDSRVPAGVVLPPLQELDSFQRAANSRRPTVGNLINDPAESWVFPVRAPVIRDGVVKFVLTTLVRPESIRHVLTRQEVPDDWVISIVDAHGARVARSRAHEENVGGRLSPSVAALVEQGGESGFAIAESLEGDRIYTPFSRLQPSGWAAVLGMPTTFVEAAARRSVTAYGAGVLLSIVLGTLAAGVIARGITQPMRELRKAAEAVGRGEPPQPPATAIIEIHQAGEALRDAAAELRRVHAEREQLLRQEREAREHAEQANRAKEEFMAVLSHELRTPLNAVYGWARVLQADQGRDPAMVARAYDAIVRNADAQVKLIDELLDLARITAGKIHLDARAVSMAEIVHAALDAIRPAAAAKGVDITSDVRTEDDMVFGDPARLQQVVSNLLVNAVKFTGERGTVNVLLQRDDGRVSVVVRDTGQGIAPHLLPLLFERFRQADTSSTRAQGGLGLGLALVKHLVELHGGTAHAASDGEGRGSTFTITLPVHEHARAAAAAPALAAGAAETTPLDGLRVLVTDNDLDALGLTSTILSIAGATVRECESAAAALDLMSKWQPDVLLSDIEMPGEDGYSLIRKIRSLPRERGGAVPAIALSAYGGAQDRGRALAAGFNMHVAKPVDPGELTAIVASVANVNAPPG